MAEAFRPEAALIDIGMPRLNGYEVAQALRRESWGADIYLIALDQWTSEPLNCFIACWSFDHDWRTRTDLS